MGLDAVAVTTAFLLLHHVAGPSQLGDDAEGTALGDVQRAGDVTQADAGVVGDADEDAGVIGEGGYTSLRAGRTHKRGGWSRGARPST